MTPSAPSVGDIWKWQSRDNIYYVLILEEMDGERWKCLCFDDDELDNWWFRETDMPRWEFVA
jgi:hypothetical protein